YVALASGAVTLGFWWLQGDREGALVRTATVLVIACPHALGLAIPLVIAISTSLGARNGLLVKDRIALERARELQVVIFDKTGTLTKGQPVLAAVSASDRDENRVLGLASAVEADSEHPLARAIVEGARRRGIEPAKATGFESLAGRGARAQVDGHLISVGGPRLLAARSRWAAMASTTPRHSRPQTSASRSERERMSRSNRPGSCSSEAIRAMWLPPLSSPGRHTGR